MPGKEKQKKNKKNVLKLKKKKKKKYCEYFKINNHYGIVYLHFAYYFYQLK